MKLSGAFRLLSSAVQMGIDTLFANPGTTELSLVAELDHVEGIRPILTLSEGVLAGAADGYGRMMDRPAMTLTHLGPSFANGFANLHNARRAHSPILNIVGDHKQAHRDLDPLLSCDTRAIAGQLGWVGEIDSHGSISQRLAEAYSEARRYPGQIATLIAPSDHLEHVSEGPVSHPLIERSPASPVDGEALDRVATAMESAKRVMLLLGGRALRERALRAAGTIAELTGCELYCETFPARLDQGPDLPMPQRLPYLANACTTLLADFDLIVVAGTRPPIAFFCEPEERPELIPAGVATEVLAQEHEDVVEALESLADIVAPRDDVPAREPERKTPTSAHFTARTIVEVLAEELPDRAIFVDEGVSLGGAFLGVAPSDRSFSYLSLTGGTTGYGLSCAIGCALACPARRVIAMVGDGSALYLPQALYTQVREGLSITNVICANYGYRILQRELMRGASRPGEASNRLTEFVDPSVDFVSLATGFGMRATLVSHRAGLVTALQRAAAEEGPSLIEVRVS